MKKAFYLFKVSIEKSVKELVRYKFNTISDILSFYMLFIAMFFGLKFFGSSINASPVSLGETLEGLVVGFFLWTVMFMAYSDTAYTITDDASKGTLEQISMSSLGLHKVVVVRSISNMIVNFLVCFIVLFSIMATTNYWLNIKVGQLILIIMLGIFSILGIALIFGGLALIFKKIKSLLNIIQYFLLGIVIPGPGAFSDMVSSIIPFRPTVGAIFNMAIGGESLADISSMQYGIIIANSAAYFIVGLIVFDICYKIAKKKGVLGQY